MTVARTNTDGAATLPGFSTYPSATTFPGFICAPAAPTETGAFVDGNGAGVTYDPATAGPVFQRRRPRIGR